jgi:hypothetical protein
VVKQAKEVTTLKLHRLGVCLLISLVVGSHFTLGQSGSPKNGYVPDEATAIRIAEAVFIPIYGEKHVRSERPFHATLQGDYWVVRGSLPKPKRRDEIVVGGTMTAEIDHVTGRVKEAYHAR